MTQPLTARAFDIVPEILQNNKEQKNYSLFTLVEEGG